jgi:hypothetical protein
MSPATLTMTGLPRPLRWYARPPPPPDACMSHLQDCQMPCKVIEGSKVIVMSLATLTMTGPPHLLTTYALPAPPPSRPATFLKE